MLDALMDAGYSLRDAAAALNLSATDLLDASESAAEPLAALDRFSRQVAELQVLDSRMQALKALVKVCNDTPDLEKKRLAAQAILRFDPWRVRATDHGGRSPRPRPALESQEAYDDAATPRSVPHTPRPLYNGDVNRAAGHGGRSNPPRSPRETRESSDDTATPLPVPHAPSALHNGESCRTAPVAYAGARARQRDRGPPDRVPRLDRPLPLSTPPSSPPAGKPCDESSIPALRVAGPITPSGITAAALAAAAGHAISVYAIIPHSARAPPLRAAA